MGLLPHTNPRHVYASEYYKRDFLRYGERLDVPDMEFRRLLPSLWLPRFLRDSLGYSTHALSRCRCSTRTRRSTTRSTTTS